MLYDILKDIHPADADIYEAAQRRWLTVAKPLHSLGRLETLISQIAAATGDIYARTDKKALIIMCADNGVVSEGVTQCGSDVTAMVAGNFKRRKASVSIMAERAVCELFPVDIGMASDVPEVTIKEEKIRYGTANMTRGAAMSKGDAERAVMLGINKVKELRDNGFRLIATGEMGIGNTTTSSAVLSVLTGRAPADVTGRGAGLSSEGLKRKICAIEKAVEVNRPDKNDVIDVISKVGGLDIAGLCGVFIGGAVYHIPIIIDGFISGTAALCAARLCGTIRDYMIPSHASNEPAGRLVLDELGLKPYLDCGMFLGEGSGAVALMPLIDMAAAVYRDMQTFDAWEDREAYVPLD